MADILRLAAELAQLKLGQRLMATPGMSRFGEKVYEAARRNLAGIGISDEQIDRLQAMGVSESIEEARRLERYLGNRDYDRPEIDNIEDAFGEDAADEIRRRRGKETDE